MAASVEINGVGSGTGTVTALGRDGIQINGTANTTVSSPFTFDLGSSLTFDTITSNPGQPITFNSATGAVVVTAGQSLTADSLAPTSGNTTLSITGTGGRGVAVTGLLTGSDEILTGTLTAAIVRASSIITTDLTTQNETINGNLILSVTSNTIGVGAFLLSTASIVNLTTTNTTATNVITTNITATTGAITTINATNIAASQANITTVNVTTLNNATNVTSTNINATNVNATNVGATTANLTTINSTTTNASTFAGTLANLTTVNVTTLQNATTVSSANVTTTDLYVNTIHARSGTTITIDSADTLLLNAIRGNPAGIELQATSGILMELNAGTFPSTWTPASAQLTLNVNANGIFLLDSTDTFVATTANITTVNTTTTNASLHAGALANITTINCTTTNASLFAGPLANLTTVNVTTLNATAVTTTDVTTTRLWTNLIPRRTAAVTEIWNALGLQLGLTDGTLPSSLVPSAGKLTLDVDTVGGVFQLATGDIIAADFANITTVNVTTLQNATTISGTNHSGSLANLTTVNVTTLQNATLVSTTNVSADSMSAKTANTTLTFQARGTGGVDFGTTPVKLGTAAGYPNATGDLWYRNSAGNLQPLPIGSNGQMMNVASGLPGWTSSGSGSITVKENANSYAGTTTLQINGANAFTSSQSGATTNVTAAHATLGFSNLAIQLATTNTSVTAAVDVIALTNSSNEMLLERTVNVTGGLATTWLSATSGGLDTGTAAIDTWYAIFLIAKQDGTGVSILLSTSSTAPTMPASYTHKRRIGWCRSKHASATQPIDFIQANTVCAWRTNVDAVLTSDGCQLLNASATVYTDVDASPRVPPTARVMYAQVFPQASGGSNQAYTFSREKGNTNQEWFDALLIGVANGELQSVCVINLNSSQVFQYKDNAATTKTILDVQGYWDNL